jgi:hypothetical protein
MRRGLGLRASQWHARAMVMPKCGLGVKKDEQVRHLRREIVFQASSNCMIKASLLDYVTGDYHLITPLGLSELICS